MNKRNLIEIILYTIMALSVTLVIYTFITMMMARNELYEDVMICMGSDRSEAKYDACFKSLKNPPPEVEPEACL